MSKAPPANRSHEPTDAFPSYHYQLSAVIANHPNENSSSAEAEKIARNRLSCEGDASGSRHTVTVPQWTTREKSLRPAQTALEGPILVPGEANPGPRLWATARIRPTNPSVQCPTASCPQTTRPSDWAYRGPPCISGSPNRMLVRSSYEDSQSPFTTCKEGPEDKDASRLSPRRSSD